MKKRTSKIQEFTLTNGAKPVCAKLGSNSSLMASGDTLNTISLWRLNKDRPILSFTNPSSNSGIQNESSCICFGINENEVYSGTNRGVVNVWDINGQKCLATLKGHTANISSIANFDLEDKKHLILSGSSDTTIKLWDLRQKNCVNTYKGHTMDIKCLEVSPDGNWLASGSQDNKIKIWEISTGKILQTFENHESAILCAKFNPRDLTLATGSLDKTLKYFQLEKWTMIFSSKGESSGILALKFNEDGTFLYTATQESLKVWTVSNNTLQLMDTIDSNWRGIQDLGIGKTDEGKSLIGITITPICFGSWAVPYKQIRFDGSGTPDKKDRIKSVSSELSKMKSQNDSKTSSTTNLNEKNNDIVKNLTTPNANDIQSVQPISTTPQNNSNKQNLDANAQVKKESPNEKNLPKRISTASVDQTPINDLNLGNEKWFDNMNQNSSEEDKIDTDIANNLNNQTIHFNQNNNIDNSLNYTAFININPEVKKQNELIFNMMKDHTKFKGVMATRINHLKPVLHWLTAGNMKSAINAINMMQIADPTLALDLLNMSTSFGKNSPLPMEAGCVFLQKAAFLIDGKIDVHIKKGIEFVSNILKTVNEDIIAIKSGNVVNMNDISKEEKIKKYDKLIEGLEKIFNLESLKKRADKKKDDLGEVSLKLRNDLESFLNKTKKNTLS